MIEQHYRMGDAAKIAGISRDTLMRWLAVADVDFVRGARGRGKVALIPEGVLRRILAAHSVRPTRFGCSVK